MKKFFLLCALLLITLSAAAHEHLNYTLIKQPYRLSTYFEMMGEHGYIGRVIKDSFHVRSVYDLYDEKGHYNAQGICRAFSLGSVYSWAREIDIYDHHGHKLGMIQGTMFTMTSAAFYLYDKHECLQAIAYLDLDRCSFTVVDSSREEKVIGVIKRVYGKKESEWKVHFYEMKNLHPAILKIFSAFISDCEEDF